MSLLEELVKQGERMGLYGRELDVLRAEYNFAYHHHLETSVCEPGIRAAIDNIEAAQANGYMVGMRYIQKTVDDWHKQGDGSQ